jgi:hypothetical protein
LTRTARWVQAIAWPCTSSSTPSSHKIHVCTRCGAAGCSASTAPTAGSWVHVGRGADVRSMPLGYRTGVRARLPAGLAIEPCSNVWMSPIPRWNTNRTTPPRAFLSCSILATSCSLVVLAGNRVGKPTDSSRRLRRSRSAVVTNPSSAPTEPGASGRWPQPDHG